MSRLETALANLHTTKENYTAAASRIEDADVASESAELTRANILKQTAASVLSQASLQPRIVLQLLGT
jgi:flagellin